MRFITRNFWLKIVALFLAIIIWVYVVGELNKGSLDEKAFLERILPSQKTPPAAGIR